MVVTLLSQLEHYKALPSSLGVRSAQLEVSVWASHDAARSAVIGDAIGTINFLKGVNWSALF